MLELLRRVGRLVPECGLKERVRNEIHNARSHGRARFARRGDSYTVTMAGRSFQTSQPPYGVLDLLDRYQRWHTIAPGETIVDVGAHWGVVALALSALTGPTGTVVAMEPDDINRGTMQRNLALNPQITNIRLLDEALWDKCEVITFCERGALGSSAMWDQPGFAKIQKFATTLDRIRCDLSLKRIDLVVMNAEGAELKALDGATEVIEMCRPAFAIASNHFVDGDYTFKVVEKQLRARGYEVETVWFGQDECITYGRFRNASRASG